MSKKKSKLSLVEKQRTPYPLKSIKSRLINDLIFNILCCLAGIIVLIFLISIAATLISKGSHGWTAQLFTQITPPPGETTGGLKNAIIGSLIMSFLELHLRQLLELQVQLIYQSFAKAKS